MFRVKPEFIGLVSIALIGGLLLPRLKALGRGTYPAKEGAPRVPVLVELFTSEGCSDCPPADALLEKLDRTQPVPGAEVIVLSEHVDYWNDLGWRDPYSSHEYSERQEAFARQFGLGSVYTPQMVVDGTFQVVGSDERRAIQAIRDAVEAPKIPVALSSMHFEEGAVGVHIGVSSAPLASSGQSINVFLAIADESDESHVSHGENAGRSLKLVGRVDGDGGFAKDVRIARNSTDSRMMRLVAFLEEAATGRILGVTAAQPSR